MPHVPKNRSGSSTVAGGIPVWMPGTIYSIDDIVYLDNTSTTTSYASGLFACVGDHTSSSFDSNISNWRALTSAYVHSQSVLSATWQIDHGLSRFPSVTIYNSSNNIIDGAVEYSTPNRLFVKFNTTLIGSVYCV